jgi:hypothetical protein
MTYVCLCRVYVMGDTAQSRMHASRPAYDPHCLQRHIFQELSSEPSSATMNGFFARLVDFENIPMLCVYVMGYTAQGRKQPRNLMPRCYDPHCLQRHSFLMGVYVMGYTAQGRKQPRNLMPRCYDPHCLQRHLFHTHTYLGRFAKICGYTYA